MLINDLKYFEYMAGLKTQYYALDSPTHHFHLKSEDWFDNYPIQDFDYQFNSWGFRGPEYDKYVGTTVNICLGDSFTVNLGGPIEYSWASQLNKLLDLPTINLSMNGAGNDTLRLVYDRACKIFDVQKTFVMYSYLHRRLIDNEFAHYGGNTGFKPAPLHTDQENFNYFEQFFIDEAYHIFLPTWNYTNTELKYIEKYSNFKYPTSSRKKWVNRDFNHMNKELNLKIARYFYELSCTDS